MAPAANESGTGMGREGPGPTVREDRPAQRPFHFPCTVGVPAISHSRALTFSGDVLCQHHRVTDSQQHHHARFRRCHCDTADASAISKVDVMDANEDLPIEQGEGHRKRVADEADCQ